MPHRSRAVLLLFLLSLPLGCARERSDAPRELVLASTTSTEDSGLFDVLLPAFAREHPEYQVKLVAVGSGEALALGRRKDADVLLVHAPAEEDAFMSAGHGGSRRRVMHNDFVIAGPSRDAAKVRGTTSAAEALRRIAEARASFVSRGDSSGTHRKELALWSAATIEARGAAWYMEIGQGMGDALRVANEREAYVLTDRGTYLSMQRSLDIVILFEGDEALFNPYSVITVAGARNAAGADAFAAWIVSPEARSLIGDFGVQQFGRPLFVPER